MHIIIRLGLNAKVLTPTLFLIFSLVICNYALASGSCVIENDMQISLYTDHDKYVAAEKKDGKLIGNRKKLRSWEKFTVITHDTGEISLKSFHGKYVAAEEKDGKLIANRKSMRGWEKFTVITHDTGEISLKSSHGKYVAAEQKGGKLIANRKSMRGWEKFTLIHHVGDTPIVCKKVLTQAEEAERVKAEAEEAERVKAEAEETERVKAEADETVIEIFPNTTPDDPPDNNLPDESTGAIAGLAFLTAGCWVADTGLWIMPPIFFGASKVAAAGVAEECLSLSSELAVAGAGTVIASKITKRYQDQDGHVQEPSATDYPDHYKLYPAYDIDVKCHIATNLLEREIPAIACEYGDYLLQIAYTESNLFKAYLTTADLYKELSVADLEDLFHDQWHEWFIGGTDDVDRYLNGIGSPFNSDKAQWLSASSVSNQQLIRPLIADINNGKQEKNKYFINISFNADMDEGQIEEELKDYCKNLQQRLHGGVYDNCVRKFIRSSTIYNEILNELDLTYYNLHNISLPSNAYSQGRSSTLTFNSGDKLSTAYHQAYYQNHNNWEMVNTAYIQALAKIIASQYRMEILAQYDDNISIDLANKFNNSLKQLIEYINIVEFYTALEDLGHSQPSNTISLTAAEYDKLLKVCDLDTLCSQHIEMASYYKSAIEGVASAYSASLHLQPILQPVIQGVENILTLANAIKSWIDQHAYAYANSEESLYKQYEEGNTRLAFLKPGVEIFQNTSPALAALVYEADSVQIEVHIDAEQQLHFYYVHADGAMEKIAIIGDFLPSLTYDRLQQMRTTVSTEEIKEIIGLFSPVIEDVKRVFQQDKLVVEEYTGDPDKEYTDDPYDAAANTVTDTRWMVTYDSDEARLILINKQLHTTLYWSPNSHHIYLKNPRYISADFAAEYEISLEIYLVLQRIKSSIEEDYPYLLALDDRLVTEFGGCFCKGKAHVSGSSSNEPAKPKRIIDGSSDQSNDTGNQQSEKTKVADPVKEKKEDRPSLCRAVSPLGASASTRGFISAGKAVMESEFLKIHEETHKFACFSIAVSRSFANPNHYTFRRWNLGNGINALWAIDCNMDSDAVDIELLVGPAHNCMLTTNTNSQTITVFILVPKATPPEVSFARAFQNDAQIMIFYGLVPYANNLPGIQELDKRPEDPRWYMKIVDTQRMFSGATGLRKVVMVMDDVQNTSYMFSNASSFLGWANVNYYKSNIDAWDTSSVTNMASMFFHATNFNGDISRWNTGNVANMELMFSGATIFNRNINGWDTSNVTNMASMFRRATNFNRNINGWNTSSVTNMATMFSYAINFNRGLSDWDTSNVTDMNFMFNNATNFNGDLSGWNIGRVESMAGMFFEATSFNGDISGWDTASVTSMDSMFSVATSFNVDISGWDTASVTSMDSMFWKATNFNRNIGGWDIRKVTNMQRMFMDAGNFNGNISGWDTGNVTIMESMFSQATNFNGDISGWNTGNVANMELMFSGATNFNSDISGWNTGNVTNMRSMFWQATNFNRDISRWNVGKVAEHGRFADGSALAAGHLPNF